VTVLLVLGYKLQASVFLYYDAELKTMIVQESVHYAQRKNNMNFDILTPLLEFFC